MTRRAGLRHGLHAKGCLKLTRTGALRWKGSPRTRSGMATEVVAARCAVLGRVRRCVGLRHGRHAVGCLRLTYAGALPWRGSLSFAAVTGDRAE